MGEVATVAAIAGGIMTSGITGLVTWRVSRNAASVELVKVAAENHRLQYGNQEEERRNRQSTYHKHLDVVIEIYNLMGSEAPAERVDGLRDDYRFLHSGVLLFAPSSVRAAAYEVSDVYNEAWLSLAQQEKEHPGKSAPERWRDATAPIQYRFGQKISRLTTRMHADVTRGIADDPKNQS
jgi:hypothetical protein